MEQAMIIINIGKVLIMLISVIEIFLILRAILSWLPDLGSNKFGAFVYKLTEPILLPFRRLVSRSVIEGNMMFDVSFIVAILVLQLANQFVIRVFLPY